MASFQKEESIEENVGHGGNAKTNNLGRRKNKKGTLEKVGREVLEKPQIPLQKPI